MKNIAISENSAYLVTDRLMRKYLTDVDIAEGYLVVGRESAYFTDARYFFAAKEKLSGVGITAKLFCGLDGVFEYIKSIEAKELLIDFSTTTVREFNDYKKYAIDLKDSSEYFEKVRSIKTPSEIEKISVACKIAQTAYHNAIEKVYNGITELQLKNLIEGEIIEQGAQGASFDIIVAFGKNSAVPHHETGETKLQVGMPILIDMGAICDGYMSDITRMAYFGTPSERFLDAYEAVYSANLKAEQEIYAGMEAVVADGVAREYLKNIGYGEYFTHSLGHGVGMQIHEYPTLSPKSVTKLENGMVFTIEPGVYFDGEFGIRIEDTVLMENGKIKRLFSDDKSLKIIKI